MQLSLLPILASLGLISALSGCVTSQSTPYPNDWPTVAASSGSCDRLSGWYANQAIGHSAENSGMLSETKRLAFILEAPPQKTSELGVEDVELKLEDTHIFALALVGGQPEPTSFAHLNDWKCNDGELTADVKDWRTSEQDLVRRNRETITLSAAVDGSLIVHVSGRNSGIAFFIPYSASGSFWSRYARSKR